MKTILKPWAWLLPFALLTSAAASPLIRENNGRIEVTDSGLQMTVGKTDGKIEVRQIGGLRLINAGKNVPFFGRMVFSARELESGTPDLKWSTSVDSGKDMVRIIQKTSLSQSAGIDMEGLDATRILEIGGKDSLTIEYVFQNPGKSPRFVSFGIRNEFFTNVNGTDYAYVPTENNVLDFCGGNALWGYYTPPDPWFFDLTAGWYGIINKGTHSGIVMIFDYDTASAVYIGRDCRTNGLLLDGGMLAPGKTFRTAIQILPMRNLSSLHHASQKMIAGFEGDAERVNIGLIPRKSGNYSGNLKVFEAQSQKILGEFPLKFSGTKGKPQTFSFTIPKPKTQTVNRVEMNGEVFEQYRENGFRMQSLPMIPLKVAYRRTAPARKELASSDDSEAGIVRENSVLLLFGPYANFFRFDRIFEGCKIKTIPAIPQGIREIPPAATIDRYQYIILADVNMESIRGIQPRLVSYVKKGGTLIVAGGPFAFGCGGYAGSLLGTLLPVEPKPFDLRPAMGDDNLNQPAKSEAGDVYWVHKTDLRPKAVVLLKAESLPLLVEGGCEKGKVYALLAAPLGDGASPFWNSENYVKLMKKFWVAK